MTYKMDIILKTAYLLGMCEDKYVYLYGSDALPIWNTLAECPDCKAVHMLSAMRNAILGNHREFDEWSINEMQNILDHPVFKEGVDDATATSHMRGVNEIDFNWLESYVGEVRQYNADSDKYLEVLDKLIHERLLRIRDNSLQAIFPEWLPFDAYMLMFNMSKSYKTLKAVKTSYTRCYDAYPFQLWVGCKVASLKGNILRDDCYFLTWLCEEKHVKPSVDFNVVCSVSKVSDAEQLKVLDSVAQQMERNKGTSDSSNVITEIVDDSIEVAEQETPVNSTEKSQTAKGVISPTSAPDRSEDLMNFINAGEKAVAVVDCENSNLDLVISVLKSINGSKKKIRKVILIDDDSTHDLWNELGEVCDVKIKHIHTERVVSEKSVVDMQLALTVQREKFVHSIDRFILFASDSDYMCLIDNVQDKKTNFFVIYQYEKVSCKYKAKLQQKGVEVASSEGFTKCSIVAERKNKVLDAFEEMLNTKNRCRVDAVLTELTQSMGVSMTEADINDLTEHIFANISIVKDGTNWVSYKINRV